MDPTYKTFHPNTKACIFSSSPHETFSKIDNILHHKASLNTYKKIELASCILSNHNGLNLDFNNDKNSRKNLNSWKLNNSTQNDYQRTLIFTSLQNAIEKYLILSAQLQDKNIVLSIIHQYSKLCVLCVVALSKDEGKGSQVPGQVGLHTKTQCISYLLLLW